MLHYDMNTMLNYYTCALIMYIHVVFTFSQCSEMYDTFDPYSVCLYLRKPTNRQYEIQCELYRTLVTGGDHKYEIVLFTLYINITSVTAAYIK